MADAPKVTAEDAAQYLPEALQRPLIFDLLNATPVGQAQLSLIRSQAAKGATDGEVALYLELCAQYSLDWNSGEAWCAVSNADNPSKRRVLLMTGRNGLRKIAQRQGLEFDGDVVHEHDAFRVTRKPDRTREIEHFYEENQEGRGPIKGAWCEVYKLVNGRQCGYFYAPLGEYRPKSQAKLDYSPWGSQESVMILAAAERQALGQATPLGGLVAVGELDRIEETAASGELLEGTAIEDAEPVDLPPEVEAIVARATKLGHAGWMNRDAAHMAAGAHMPAEAREAWVLRGTAELDRAEAAWAEDAPLGPQEPEESGS